MDIRGTDKIGHKGRARFEVDIARRTGLCDDAVLQQQHPIRQGQSLGLIMGHVDRGEANLLLQGADLGADLIAQLCVKVRQWLVKQHHARRNSQGAGQRDALLLPARQCIGELFCMDRQAHLVD